MFPNGLLSDMFHCSATCLPNGFETLKKSIFYIAYNALRFPIRGSKKSCCIWNWVWIRQANASSKQSSWVKLNPIFRSSRRCKSVHWSRISVWRPVTDRSTASWLLLYQSNLGASYWSSIRWTKSERIHSRIFQWQANDSKAWITSTISCFNQ